MKRRLFQVDAFTYEKFVGNPAGIILDADGLTDIEMQKIARELNNPESAFVFKTDSPDFDLKVRFFTPFTEVPMCGHNTVALHVVRALEGEANEGIYRQHTKAGIIPVEIKRKGNSFEAIMTQSHPSFDEPLNESKKLKLLQSLGLTIEDLRNAFPVQIVSTGNRKVFVGVSTRTILSRLEPNMQALKQLSQELNCTGYYVFALESEGEIPLTRGRMFAPQIGIDEDPVTGMGVGPLGAYLVHNRLVNCEGTAFEFVAEQGEAMGRKGQARVRVSIANGMPIQVQVGGEAIIVFKSEIST